MRRVEEQGQEEGRDQAQDQGQDEGEERGQEPGGEVGRYRIGSVADLTGIPPHTLRAWERRYGASEPGRTDAGFRLYSEDDVGRLTLIKRLSDLGHAIGSIANLSLKDLQERLARVEERGWRGGNARKPSLPAVMEGPVPVVLLEPAVDAQIREAGGESAGIRVLGSASDPDGLHALLRELEDRGPVVLVVGLSRLGAAPAPVVRQLLEEAAVSEILVLYDFAPRKVLRQVSVSGGRLVQGWPGVDSLRRLAREALTASSARRFVEATAPANGNGHGNGHGHPAVAVNPPRVFTDGELGRLREVESAVDCECPNHMARILASLVAFEEYSLECESRDARDAELHAHLHRESGRARAILENALLHLCREEGIEL